MTFLFDWFVRPLLALMAPVMLVLAVSGCGDMLRCGTDEHGNRRCMDDRGW